MDGAKTVTAQFDATSEAQYYGLTITETGTGSGTVTSSLRGISCPSDCSEQYPQGTTVNLNATADAGSTFTGWSGSCSGIGTCTVTMDEAKTVTAQFDSSNSSQPTLRVQKSGMGSGIVKSSPKGITCGDDCEEVYSLSSKPKKVKLMAKADKGSKFGGWSGDCSGMKTSCSLMLDASREVTAVFGKPQISVSEEGLSFGDTGQGEVVSRVLTISNAGDADLNIKSMKVIGKAAKMYKILSDETGQKISKVNLSPGQSITLEIQYNPTSIGSHDVTMQLKSDDPDTPIKEIPLDGNGI
jgi:hypothetical protein